MSGREWQIEMLWRCSTCPTKCENLGRDKVCKNCGAPKKESDEFYMPGDTRYESRVTDTEQLDDAHAGPDWSCRYCGSAQRRNDGECARCGVPQAEGTRTSTVEQDPFRTPATRDDYSDIDNPPPATAMPPPPRMYREGPLGGVVAVIIAIALITGLYFLFRTRDVYATVSGVQWAYTIPIERYQVVSDDGFDPPGDAFDVTRTGSRIHHYDRVHDGSHQEPYSVLEACGQDCRPTPKICSQSCTSNKNGYATCRESCSGGGQSCSTRYCSRTRYRTVEDYHNEPVYRPYYGWHAWRWRPHRNAVTSGRDFNMRWPDTTPPSPLAMGEQEREGARRAAYDVTFRKQDETWTYHPNGEVDFRRFEPGHTFHLKVAAIGSVEVMP